MRRIFFLLLLSGCASRHAMMNRDTYASVDIGSPIQQVEKTCGKPYQITSKGGNTDTYEYLERITMGTQTVQVRHYYLVVSNGKVVGKYMRFTETPAIYDELDQESPYANY